MSSATQLSIQTSLNPFELYSDSRTHGYQGSSRNVRLGRVTPPGGGYMAKSEDGNRVVVAGKESLRILRLSEPSQVQNPEHKFAVGVGGHRVDASRNFWEGSGLKIDSASTDVAWGHGQFNNKILTSARNGELILWDLNKSGSTKLERRTKDHIRSIHKMSVSHVVHNYCITGSADGHMRVWDLRDLSKSIMRIHHPTSVRSLVFSPSLWQPVQAVVGLDNGSIYRWDLKMGQRGQLDKLPVAHTASVTALDWCSPGAPGVQASTPIGSAGDPGSNGLGWLVSGGLDRCVKVWDLSSPSGHIPHKPTYTLHPSFAVRRLAWRPGYECEIAVVSNTEYATPSVELPQPPANSGVPGILTRVGSGLGLDSIMRGSNLPEGLYSVKDKLNAAMEIKSPVQSTSLGDAVEIWDVRRPWLAKWSVTGSAAEGGVTDIAFSDSHAIWAQQASGSFSQFDLRETTKPIDAVSRVAVTWEVGGSMTFVADSKERWEIPYDDVQPDQRNPAELPKPPKKALGDPTAKLLSQTMASFNSLHDTEGVDRDVFTILARKYIFEGRGRQEICIINAEIAIEAGHEVAAQVWLLLGAALAQYVPDLPPTPPQSPRKPSKNLSAPSGLLQSPHQPQPLSSYSFPSSTSTRPVDFSPAVSQKVSPVTTRSTSGSVSRPPSYSHANATSRRLTPTSSTSSSPRHLPVSLPPVTPRRSSFFGRRDSLDASAMVHAAMIRRPSLPSSAFPHASSSPVDKTSLRHVGEGVLDDSDSSSADGDEEGDETAGANSSDGEAPPLVSPGLTALRSMPLPSPLSRVAGRQVWTEDEGDKGKHKDDDDSSTSPSPQSSSDSDSNPSSSPRRRSASRKAHRRNSSRHFKTRSRSSTVASLAAPQPRPLIHHESQSSIRTVTGAEAVLKEQDDILASSDLFIAVQDRTQDSRAGHARQRSQAMSELALNTSKVAPNNVIVLASDPNESVEASQLTERRIDIIKAEDNRLREATLSALQAALEEFADEGDIQMCAMLALVAADELHISKPRVTRFVEGYVELLTRLRLHTCAAYLRKHCDVEEVRKTTLLETIIYTSCGKCRKPLLLPAGTLGGRTLGRGTFSYCMGCKASTVMCCICRLPVRSLLFQCNICNHGGHQACYRQYYMQQPMVDYPASFLASDVRSRGRTSLRPQTFVAEDESISTASLQSGASEGLVMQSPSRATGFTTLAGHPCAAGCGHICWAANKGPEDAQ